MNGRTELRKNTKQSEAVGVLDCNRDRKKDTNKLREMYAEAKKDD